MLLRAFAVGLSSLVSVAAAAATDGYWVDARPADATETSVREAIAKAAFAGPEATATALLALADAGPATPGSALARLAAGLELLDASQPEAALQALRHPELPASPLADHALFGIARALEARKDAGAAAAYVAVADARPAGPLACVSLFRSADLAATAGDHKGALAAAQRALESCPTQAPHALIEIGQSLEKLRDAKAAAAAYDRLDREFPASSQARAAQPRLLALSRLLPPATPAERDARSLAKALALFDTSQWSAALPLLRALKARPLPRAEADLVRVRLARAQLQLKRTRDAEAELRAVPADSPHGAEAAYYRARIAVARTRRPDAYEAVAADFAGSAWAEEALLALANHYQKDARDDEALPYYRRLLAEYPDGSYADRSAWRVGWGDYRQGRYADAARTLEDAARRRKPTSFTPGMLYWAGRAKQALGDSAGARALMQEVEARFKHSYHGLRAGEALATLPRGPRPEPLPAIPPPGLAEAEPEPLIARVRLLLLIDRLDEAYEELALLPASPLVNATRAMIDHRRGRLRPAIVSMKRAYPDWVSESGASLPDEVWRVLFPLEFDQLLRRKAAEEGVDPALVAGLICQESTFNPGAVSVAGARGLMQVIPPTGRALARQLGRRYRTNDLLSPEVSLDFGTLYLRQMLDRFGGRVERVLAAYNAGPHRVDAWTAGRPDVTEEEFVESIPFTETRHYVMTVLANREHYRRLYGLGPQPPSPEASTAQAGPR